MPDYMVEGRKVMCSGFNDKVHAVICSVTQSDGLVQVARAKLHKSFTISFASDI